MKKVRASFLEILKQPVETITALVSLGLFIIGAYMFSPLYDSASATSPTAIALISTSEIVLATFFVLGALPALLSPFIKAEYKFRALKASALSSFAAYLFLAILRVSLFGFIPLTWLPTTILALISGYLVLWYRTKRNG